MPNYLTCGKCDRYSRSLGRCIDGKVNPPTLKGTKECLLFYREVGKICNLSKWKKKAIEQLIDEIRRTQ